MIAKGEADRSMNENSSYFATVEAAIEDFKAGRIVIVVDDEDRENEGDLTIASGKSDTRSNQFYGTPWPWSHLLGDDGGTSG